MQIGIDLSTNVYKPNQSPDLTTVLANATVNGSAMTVQPLDWSKVKATAGVGTPQNGVSFLSVQPDGSFQWRQTAAQWETFYVTGGIAAINPGQATQDPSNRSTYSFVFAQIG